MDQLTSGPNDPITMPGPKFGQEPSWWARNRSNIILAIIGVLIIAGGIYLYKNYQMSSPIAQLEQENQTAQEIQDSAIKPDQVNINEQTGQPASNKIAQTQPDKSEIVKVEGNKYTVKANKGAGVTHLARKAAKDYIEKNSELKNKISAEQKIYIEDYIKDKTGSQSLRIGQELTFDDGLIKEAIDQSLKLNEKQLQNLHKYVLLVPSLQS